MDVREWIRFLTDGEPPVVSISRLPTELCRAIGCSANLVQLRHDYARKCCEKHRFEAHHLDLMKAVIDYGTAVCDRDGHLTFFYFDRLINSWLKVVVKSNSHGTELWVATFHRTKEAQYRSRTRHNLLRE